MCWSIICQTLEVITVRKVDQTIEVLFGENEGELFTMELNIIFIKHLLLQIRSQAIERLPLRIIASAISAIFSAGSWHLLFNQARKTPTQP